MEFIEQVQGTAILLVIYSFALLQLEPGKQGKYLVVEKVAAYTLLVVFIASGFLFFVTTLARIWG